MLVTGLIAVTAMVLCPRPAPAGDDDPFTIVVVPDPQGYSNYQYYPQFPTRFNDHIQWIVDQKDAQNIAFVTGVGDHVQNFWQQTSEWNVAKTAYDKLHVGNNPANAALIPYSLTIGNHDYDMKKWLNASDVPAPLRADENIVNGSSKYRSTFGPARFAGQSWFGGSDAGWAYNDPTWGTQNGVGLNTYQTFQAGGRTFLHLNLELGAPDESLDWAESVLAAHPDLPTLVSTHSLLNGDGSFTSADKNWRRYIDMTYTVPGNSGQQIWDKFITKHDQIFTVFCGHTWSQWTEAKKNDYGGDVHLQLVCYTFRRLMLPGGGEEPNNGAGWLRTLEFDPESESIHVRTYSTVLDEYVGNDGGDVITHPHGYPLAADSSGTFVPQKQCDFYIDFDWDARFAAPIPGDANRDGVVNVGDLAILAGNWEQPGCDWTGANFNFDPLVDVGDLAMLAGHWGDSVVGGADVPEPVTLALLAVGAAALLGRGRRR